VVACTRLADQATGQAVLVFEGVGAADAPMLESFRSLRSTRCGRLWDDFRRGNGGIAARWDTRVRAGEAAGGTDPEQSDPIRAI